MSPAALEAAVEADQASGSEGFVASSLERFRENMEMLLGVPMALTLEEVLVEGEAAVRVRLPRNGLTCLLKTSGREERGLLVVELPLAQTLLGLSRMVPEEEVAHMREEAAPPQEQDCGDLTEVDNFLAAAFCDESQARAGGRTSFEPAGVQVLKEALWSSGKDPLEAQEYLLGKGTITIGDGEEQDPFLMLLPHQAILSLLQGCPPDKAPEPPEQAPQATQGEPERKRPEGAEAIGDETQHQETEAQEPLLSTAPEGRPPAAAGEARILCLVPADMVPQFEENLEGGVQFVHRPSGLLQYLEQQKAPDLVISFVGRQDGHLLRMLSAARQTPALKHHPLLVMLEVPNRRWVVRCGQLGLDNVLPADSSPTLLRARIARLLSYRKAG